MLIFWEKKFALLATPKTGTTALQAVLAPYADIAITDPPQLKHASIQRFRRHIVPLCRLAGEEKFVTAAMIREPIDWLRSWYQYRGRPKLAGHANSTAGISFQEFAEGYLSNQRPDFAEVGSQARFLTGNQGNDDVTHLFRYEAFDTFVEFLQRELDLTIAPGRINQSASRDSPLDARTERRRRRKLSVEYELWETAQTA